MTETYIVKITSQAEEQIQEIIHYTRHGHACGEFIKPDNVFDVIYHNSHEYYT